MRSNLFCSRGDLKTLVLIRIPNLFAKVGFATGSFPNDRDEYLYNTHTFRIVEEEKVFRRTSIEYLIGHSSKPAQIRTCEIDGLNVVNFTSSSKRLFSTLLEHGRNSRYITHFAECESRDEKYTAFSTKRVLFQRRTYISDKKRENPCSSEGPEVCNTSSGKSQITKNACQYRLEGGMLSYYWISENDPTFFSQLSSALDLGLCEVKRLDICVDHSEDLMPLLSEDIKCGRVNGFGRDLRGMPSYVWQITEYFCRFANGKSTNYCMVYDQEEKDLFGLQY